MNLITFVMLITLSILSCEMSSQDKFSQLLPSPADNSENSQKMATKTQFEPVAVVELFTSQGCSSCPPADHLLGKIAAEAAEQNQRIYALSFHVDYWNYLGWRDPYSDAAFSDRQRRYASAFHSSRIYTPQMIVNGKDEFVGSNRREAKTTIQNALKISTKAEIKLTKEKPDSENDIRLSYSLSGETQNAVLRFALVEKNVKTDVSRGENGGRS